MLDPFKREIALRGRPRSVHRKSVHTGTARRALPACRGRDARDQCRLRVLGQYVFYQIRPVARAYGQYLVVKIVVRIMQHASALARPVADKYIAARLGLQHEGEVFRTHYRRHPDDVLRPDHALQHRCADFGVARGIDGGRIAAFVAYFDLGAVGCGDAGADLAQAALDEILHFGPEGAGGAAQDGCIGNHVPGVAGVNLCDSDDRRLDRIDVAAGDGLQRLHQRRCGDYRVDARMRQGGVGPASRQFDLEDVERGHHRSGPQSELPDRHAWPVVHAINRFAWEFVEQALLHHLASAALVLLCGLEDEIHRAVEVLGLG